MYQAIVFLPLLGAILAALVSLAGARARCPGEGPPPPEEEGAARQGRHMRTKRKPSTRMMIMPRKRPPPPARAPRS
jgi:hypothetical protein